MVLNSSNFRLNLPLFCWTEDSQKLFVKDVAKDD
jgi:hypothetical protein